MSETLGFLEGNTPPAFARMPGSPPPPFADGFAETTQQQEFSLLDVTQAASRVLDIGVNEPALGMLAGQLLPLVNQKREFQRDRGGLEGSAFRQLLLQNLTPDVAKLVDPAQAERFRKEQAAAGGNDPSKKFFDPSLLGGGRPSGVRGADRGGDAYGNGDGSISRPSSGGYIRSDVGSLGGYLSLSYDSPLALASITRSSFGLTPFASPKCGLNFDTFNSLRQYNFTGSQILGGVHDAKDILGPKLDVNGANGAAIVRDMAGLRKEAPKQAPGIVKALKKEGEMIDKDAHVHATIGDTVDAAKSGASDEEMGAKAQAVAKAAGAVQALSGAGAAVNDPSLTTAAHNYAVDARAKVLEEKIKAFTAKQCAAKGVSPGQCAVVQQRIIERVRIEAEKAGPPATPAAGAPALTGSPQQPKGDAPPPQGGKFHKAEAYGDLRRRFAALSRPVADAAVAANKARDVAFDIRDEKLDEKARRDEETKKILASGDDVFAMSDATPAAKPNAAAKVEDKPREKLDAGEQGKKSPIRLASNQPAKPADVAKESDKAKQPDTAKAGEHAPVRTAAVTTKNNPSQPKPA